MNTKLLPPSPVSVQAVKSVILARADLAYFNCEQIALHQPLCIENGSCFKPVLHTSGSRIVPGAKLDLQATVFFDVNIVAKLLPFDSIPAWTFQVSVHPSRPKAESRKDPQLEKFAEHIRTVGSRKFERIC